jgi:hypothetical protein
MCEKELSRTNGPFGKIAPNLNRQGKIEQKEDAMRAIEKNFGMGLGTAVLALTLLSGSPVPAAPPDKDVTVVNTTANPVPVIGTVTTTGTSTVSGTVNAAQSGPWTVGIDPSNNTVKVEPGASLHFNPGFNVIGASGAQLDFGPFDLSNMSTLRIIARAFNNNNGDIKFQVYDWDPDQTGKRIIFDEFSLFEETSTRVYEAPPPLVLVRLTKVGGIAANYHLVLIGR